MAARFPNRRFSERSATPSELRAFEALCDRRAERARVLADRFPESAEALTFYGAVASFQKDATAKKLLDLVTVRGPDLLRDLAGELDEDACRQAVDAYQSGQDRSSPKSFFGRVLLQAETALMSDSVGENAEHCPRCAHAPQVGCLVPEGDGTAFTLSCSLCFGEWRYPRERCPSCQETGDAKLVYYHAPELEHLEVRACDGCHVYLNVVRMAKAPDAVLDVDEIAALPLDVWAKENGYRKLVRNLIGI